MNELRVSSGRARTNGASRILRRPARKFPRPQSLEKSQNAEGISPERGKRRRGVSGQGQARKRPLGDPAHPCAIDRIENPNQQGRAAMAAINSAADLTLDGDVAVPTIDSPRG